jgi:hypothetical protein
MAALKPDPFTTRRHAIDSPVGYSILDELDETVPYPAGDLSEMDWRIESPKLGMLDLHCDTGYIVTEYDLGWPDVRAVEYDRPLAHGTYDLTRFFGARAVTLTITLNGERAQIAEAMLRTRLAAFLNPSARSVLSFVETDWARRRRMVVRGHKLNAKTTDRFSNNVIATFICANPFVESYETQCETVDVSPAAGGPHKTVAHNEGDVAAEWIVEISGVNLDPGAVGSGASTQHGSGVELMMGDRRLAFMLDMTAEDKLVISSAEKSAIIVKKDGARYSAYQYMSTDSEWFLVEPGANDFWFHALDKDGIPIELPHDATIGEWTALAGRAPSLYFNVDHDKYGDPFLTQTRPVPDQAGEALVVPPDVKDAAVWQPEGGFAPGDPANPTNDRTLWALPHDQQQIPMWRWDASAVDWERDAGYMARNDVRDPKPVSTAPLPAGEFPDGDDGDHWWNHMTSVLYVKQAGVWTVVPLVEMTFDTNGKFIPGTVNGEKRADLRALESPTQGGYAGQPMARICFHSAWTS